MDKQRERYPSIRPYLGHAVGATALVVLLPALVVTLLLVALEPDPSMAVIAAAGVLVTLTTVVIGTAVWMRRPDSAFIGFSDLMLPRWVQRRRAEKDLAEGTRLLGLDPSGQPVDPAKIPPEEQLQVLKSLTAALEAKDPYTHGHSQRVERHAYRTAAAMGLSASDLEDVRKAAALHDVGKIRVPDRILRKNGPLTPDERHMIEEHSVVGAWMVSSVGDADVIAAVRHHHEHWDGSGYPDGLTGTDIPLFARIIAVADAYDAINSTRPYRASSGREHALEIIKEQAGKQFDPKVVESFLGAMPTRLPVAAGVLLALAGPQRVMRELAAWMRRFGAGNLAPAVAASGAVVVLGASVFTPHLPQKPATPPPVSVAPVQSSDDPVVLGKRVPRRAPVKKGGGSPAKVERRESRPPRPAAETATPVLQEMASTSVADVEPSVGQPEPRSDSRERNRTQQKPQPDPEPQPGPESQPDPESQDVEDCPPGHKKAHGEGHHKHEHDEDCE